MEEKQKILVCGDVEGKFKTLFNRVKAVNEKSGPFDFLFCVGDFFGDPGGEWAAVKSGSISVPVPTYILGPTDDRHLAYYSDLNGCEMCPNVNYLGRKGLLTSSGLKIAYLSGKEDSSSTNTTFSELDVDSVKNTVLKTAAGSEFLGVDIFLSSVWPKDVTRLHENCPVTEERVCESAEVARLAKLIKPRYHFAGKENIYYERPPYENLYQSGESNAHCTRFFGLGKVGSKTKWLYAASVTPINRMKALELYQVTTDQTPCPYPSDNVDKSGGKQYFYDMETSEENSRSNRKRDHQGGRKPPPQFDQSLCWFCLSSVSVEKHLVVSVSDHSYLALAKGGITELHVMILPIQHHRSLNGLPKEIFREIEKFKTALKQFFKSKKMVAVVYERNYKTSHLQVHVIPIPKSKAGRLKGAFLAASEEKGLDLAEIPREGDLSALVPADTPYFYLELPSSERFLASCKRNFPLEFAREVLADDDLLDLPHRVNWKDCVAPKAEETKIAEAFRQGFHEFDFTRDD